jgi:tRNA A37 threonylcarbamoyladenosine dehydratase
MSAVKKAAAEERARCLWILDTILNDLRKQIGRKVLVESEIHLVKVKVAIAEALVSKARRLITLGLAPKKNEPTSVEDIVKRATEEGDDAAPV